MSKLVEAIASPQKYGKIVVKFLKKNNFSRLGTTKALISDRGSHFYNNMLLKALKHYGVRHKVTSLYHLHTNGQTEVSNREIKRILEKTISSSKRDWSSKLYEVFRAYQTTFKSPIGLILFQMVYGKSFYL